MENSKLRDFQANKLHYQFKNVELLQAALTHSLDPKETDPQLIRRNKEFKRLNVLGASVLKLLICDKVVRNCEIPARPKDLSEKKDDLIASMGDVCKRLFSTHLDCIQISSGNWYNKHFKVPYGEIFNTILAAVFLDSNGRLHMMQCTQLFLRLLGNINNWMFQPPMVERFRIKKATERYWMRCVPDLAAWMSKLEERLGVKFKDRRFLVQALIHPTFYDDVRNNGGQVDLLDYEILEFLGDAVLELVIAEYVFNMNPAASEKELVMKIQEFVADRKQTEIFEKLGLMEFVLMKEDSKWKKQGDIVESIIGALAVDDDDILNHFRKARLFIARQWNLQEQETYYKFEPECAISHHITSGTTGGVRTGFKTLWIAAVWTFNLFTAGIMMAIVISLISFNSD